MNTPSHHCECQTEPGTRGSSRRGGGALFLSQKWSITHLLLSTAGPLPRGPCGGMGFGSSSLLLGQLWWGQSGACWVPTVKCMVQEQAPGKARDGMGHGEHSSFSPQGTLLPKAGKNTSSLHRYIEDLNTTCFARKLYVSLKWETKWAPLLS